MRIEQYFTYECDECGEIVTLDMLGGMMVRRCPKCSSILTGEPDAQLLMPETPATQGFYECYECGHTFGYAATGNENPYEEPNCTKCGSENTAEV